jgi:uncharacterized protein
MMDPKSHFWQTKTLEELSEQEWESLCDGCARCCLIKLEDEDDGTFHHTDVACTLLNSESCRCTNYAKRSEKVQDCVKLTPEGARTLKWLPETCAYRLIAEGRNLYDWHPLLSGTPESVHQAGISVRGKVAGFEQDYTVEELIERIRGE